MNIVHQLCSGTNNSEVSFNQVPSGFSPTKYGTPSTTSPPSTYLQFLHHFVVDFTSIWDTKSSAGIILSSPAPSVIPRSSATLSADAISLSLANVVHHSAKSLFNFCKVILSFISKFHEYFYHLHGNQIF